MVSTDHALRLAALLQIPKAAARTVDIAPLAMMNPTTAKAIAAVTVVDTHSCLGCGHAVAVAYRTNAPAVPPTTSATVWERSGRCRAGTRPRLASLMRSSASPTTDAYVRYRCMVTGSLKRFDEWLNRELEQCARDAGEDVNTYVARAVASKMVA